VLAMKRRLTDFWICAPTLAICHFLTQLATLLTVVGSGLARFDSGAAPSWLDRFLSLLNQLLSFPLVSLASIFPLHAPEWFGWCVFCANSVLWGVVAWWLIRFISSSRPASA